MRQKQKTKGNWTVVSDSLILVLKDKNQVSAYFTFTQTHAESRLMLPVPIRTRDYAASAAHTSISIIAQSFVLLGCRGSISQAAELTEYFQAAVADPISSVEAPVGTVEQQAEHCQEGKMQGDETTAEERIRKRDCLCVGDQENKEMSDT